MCFVLWRGVGIKIPTKLKLGLIVGFFESCVVVVFAIEFLEGLETGSVVISMIMGVLELMLISKIREEFTIDKFVLFQLPHTLEDPFVWLIDFH